MAKSLIDGQAFLTLATRLRDVAVSSRNFGQSIQGRSSEILDAHRPGDLVVS